MQKKINKIRVNHWKQFFASLLSVLSIASAQSQTQEQGSSTPKLVIGITIDQLRGDYLQYCMQTFGEKGFKRLLNGGLVYSNIQYDFPNINYASAIATIYTGTNPFYHGITGCKKFDFEKKKEIPVLYDSGYLGNYTSENLSPKALASSTITDELKIASGGRSVAYAISPQSAEAIISGGHAANAVFWLEDYNGKWATSTYYKDIPWYVERVNSTESVAGKIGNYSWTPALSSYNAFPYSKLSVSDKHSFYGNDTYLQFKTSPFINTEITQLAGKVLQYEDFGKMAYPAMLSLTYYAGDFKETTNKEFSWEIQDTYYRLDKEIEELLGFIEKYVGIKNTLIFVTSTGYFETPSNNPDVVQPTGMFYPNRCTALLNIYLMSVYGQGNWVEGFYQNQIYLNRKLIEDKQIPLGEIQRKAAEFTIQFSGVQDVSTFSETLYGNWNEAVERFRNGTYNGITGDIIIELKPGWLLVDDQNAAKSKYIRNNAVISPLIFFGHKIEPKRIHRTVKATQIAPSVTHVLRIRPPNAAKELPLEEFILN